MFLQRLLNSSLSPCHGMSLALARLAFRPGPIQIHSRLGEANVANKRTTIRQRYTFILLFLKRRAFLTESKLFVNNTTSQYLVRKVPHERRNVRFSFLLHKLATSIHLNRFRLRFK